MRESQVFRMNKILERKQKKYDKKQQLKTAFKMIVAVVLRDNSIHTNIQTKIDNYTDQLLREVSARTSLK